VALAAYSQVFTAGFIWDDDDYLTQNPHIPASDGLLRIWALNGESPQYYPLVFTTYFIEYRLWGLNPAGYHTVNILMHIANALLVWQLLRRMGFGGGYWVGLIFAVHPVHVESVAWIMERKNVMAGLFFLLAWHAYLRFEERGRWRHYGLAFSFFLLSLWSKTVTSSLPLLMLLARWWRGKPVGRREILHVTPFVAAGLIMGSVTAGYERLFVLHGARAAHWQMDLPERILVAGRAFWFYIGKLLWPHPLVFNYPRWEIDTGSLLQWVWPLAVLALAAGVAACRGGLRRGLAAGLGFYAISIAPALGFVNVAPMRYSFVADHFQYLASLGIIATVVGIPVWCVEAWSRGRPPRAGAAARRAAAVAGGVIVLALSVLTWSQSSHYRDIEALWRHTIQENPRSWLARGNLGIILRRRGDLDEAARQFEQVLKDWPDWAEPSAAAHTNLGNIALDRNRLDEAVAHYERAVELQPGQLQARLNLANIRRDRGELDAAIEQYRRVLGTEPSYWTAHFNLGVALERKGDAAGAEASYRAALYHQPAFGQARASLAELLARGGRAQEGIATLREGLRLDPDDEDLRIDLALSLAASGQWKESIEAVGEGLRRDPQDTRLILLLADRLAVCPVGGLRDGGEALRLLERIPPEARQADPMTLHVLAAVYAELGRREEALEAARKAFALARERGMTDLMREIGRRGPSYEAGEPYRETPRPPAPTGRSAPTDPRRPVRQP